MLILPIRISVKSPLSISIITPSFNQASFIEQAIDSVCEQNYPNCEHLVYDGLSTDETVELLKKMPGCKNQTKLIWVSEKDNGQSEALNKGFRHAQGEIIGWLNSDDKYRPGAFDAVAQFFKENPDTDILYGDYRLVDESGRLIRVRRETDFSMFVLFYHRVLYIPTTTTFFRRQVFEDGNWLREDLKYAMDLEFFIRLAIGGYRFKHISRVLADFRLQPNSKTCSFPQIMQLEHREVVLSSVPLLFNLRPRLLKQAALLVLRQIAGLRRYSEKALRGYYFRKLVPAFSYKNSAKKLP
ncbi:glycosyltransferase family 2 protein [Granulicella sp. S190]|uniref:glycosyltransferase family 2 protein n=1 Tax=Granulicella sp. S190 TaxID=1747226 RepID=UPI00131AE95C|nr:glycosyltransferase family 2 protein [Granulicella sp. S190]